MLLTAIGAKNYSLLRDLVSPATPRSRSECIHSEFK